MTNAQIAGLGVRLFAIWLIVYVLRQAPDLWILNRREADVAGIIAASIVPVLLLLIAAALWFFPLTVASKLIPRSSLAQSTSLPVEEPQRTGFLLLGLWVLAGAIPSLIRYSFLLYHTFRPGAMVELGLNLPAAMLYTCAELIIGIWLLFGARGLLGLLRLARRA